jgi:microcompartment protein CcmL/EutN
MVRQQTSFSVAKEYIGAGYVTVLVRGRRRCGQGATEAGAAAARPGRRAHLGSRHPRGRTRKSNESCLKGSNHVDGWLRFRAHRRTKDLTSIREARALARTARQAQPMLAELLPGTDRRHRELAMQDAVTSHAEGPWPDWRWKRTGYGVVEDKIQKNLFGLTAGTNSSAR